ncbi:MAG: DUF2100 domain-containing protein [Promethearchaeota archaeon]|nr:MAG: DUF2100 domain-containing protein [Candidatus Lokiarchaeota archaeon]
MVILKINSQEVKAILESIDILLEIKCLIRSIVPGSELNETQMKLFNSSLNSLKSLLEPLFSKFLQTEVIEKIKNEKFTELKKLMEKEGYILISASHSKKILKNLGFNPLKIIVSGGPLIIEDYLKINPNLSKKTLLGIERKTKNLMDKLKKIAREGSNIIFIYMTQNETDQIILEELNEIQKIIGKVISLFEISNWKIFED